MYKKLLSWSKDQHSHLPWRENRSLYLTLVSEIMLQQTTVQTVVNHIDKFISKYPSLKDLANSNEEEVCIAWKGLGYYRRARNLLSAAKEIQERYEGDIPVDIEELKKIKGIYKIYSPKTSKVKLNAMLYSERSEFLECTSGFCHELLPS